jgi:ribosomal protein L11 methyltransferase
MKPTRWLVLRVAAPPGEDQAGLVAEALLELGGRAVWQEGDALVTHLLPPDDLADWDRRAARRLEDLSGVAGLEVEISWQPHEAWEETWRRGLAPRRLTPRLIVTPSWEPVDSGPGDVVLVVDPGMAFGNAEHGTTRGSLRLLDGVLEKGARVLDVGTGSGILAIAAALLGAHEVVAIEGDPLAWETVQENLERNGVAERVRLVREWASADSLSRIGSFDGVLANLEAGIVRPLLPGIANAVVAGGWVVLSGLLEGDLEPVRARAGELDLEPASLDADGEWRSLLLRRRPRPGEPHDGAGAR